MEAFSPPPSECLTGAAVFPPVCAGFNPKEELALQFRDRGGRTVGTLWIEGDVDGVILPLPAMVAGIVGSGARFLLLSHLHPSGDPRPSAADIAATREVWRIGRMLGASLYDHVIFAPGGDQFSFRENGLL